jgi:hypothetical protein
VRNGREDRRASYVRCGRRLSSESVRSNESDNVSWEQGRDEIEGFLAAGELERVEVDLDGAKRVLADCRRHLDSVAEIKDTDPLGGFQLLYDAARKAATALLQAQGLRPTTDGSHVAVRDSMLVQFGDLSGGDIFRHFDRLRRRRRDSEYGLGDSGINETEVEDALEKAEAIVDFAERVIDVLPRFL